MSTSLRSQLAPKGLSFNPSDFFISDKYATILTVVSYPKYITPGYLSSLTNMPGIKVVVKHIPVPFQTMAKMLNRQVADLKEKYQHERDLTVRERYRQDDKINFLKFMDDVFSIESSSSYMNAFAVAGLPYFDPYAKLAMADPLDLHRVRHGDSKYLIRELFSIKYPNMPIPEKIPMPRPVDTYFSNWTGPIRHEFKKELDMSSFSGNQKWQLYALEKFLDIFEPQTI